MLKKIIKNDKGQILLVVMVVLMILFIILFAVVYNLRTDIKQQQIEREYEQGYTVAEEELYKIGSDGFEQGEYEQIGAPASGNDWTKYCQAANDECIDSNPDNTFECYRKDNVGQDQQSSLIVKRCLESSISEMTIAQDDVLEINLVGVSEVSSLTVSWQEAPAVSAMLVCKSGNDYKVVRAAICRSGAGDCGSGSQPYSIEGFVSIADASSSGPFDMGSCDEIGSSYDPILLRIRAIGSQASMVSVNGNGLPPQMERVRVQGFSAGTDTDSQLPGPEVYTVNMINKRLPALFDYVLFVADDEVKKE